jgi:hypothetical protein
MKRFILASLLWLGALTAALAQQSVVVPATMASVPITITTATTTRLIVGVSGKSIYVTAVDVISAGTGNIQFISGTGATCGTATVNVSGNYNLTAQVGFTKAAGNGAVWVLTQGHSLCAVTSAGVGMPGSVSYAIF